MCELSADSKPIHDYSSEANHFFFLPPYYNEWVLHCNLRTVLTLYTFLICSPVQQYNCESLYFLYYFINLNTFHMHIYWYMFYQNKAERLSAWVHDAFEKVWSACVVQKIFSKLVSHPDVFSHLSSWTHSFLAFFHTAPQESQEPCFDQFKQQSVLARFPVTFYTVNTLFKHFLN